LQECASDKFLIFISAKAPKNADAGFEPYYGEGNELNFREI